MKKRTCDRCKAMGYLSHGLTCLLGYKTKPKIYYGIVVSLFPLEECPKPITYNEYSPYLKRKVF